ncbi:hypothetical protein H8I69_18555 [Serratia fonticola]|uniref:hypothetical protein n=1 Tax=Serratia fonticola TaxID=47917 RepID=UPI0015C64846|nr:hypothetical protein [Serratia fonticola]MBC3381125.1 hypothetical protein [Serratia fonticola]NYA40324.1 hypothetical protein [Serratia fonticola]
MFLTTTVISAAWASEPVALKVGQHIFKADNNFPTSGFIGARFQVLMNGADEKNNLQYRWSSNQPWVSVSPQGEVRFDAPPTPETKTVSVTAAPPAGGPAFVHIFTIKNWFINDGTNKKKGLDATAWCQAQGTGYVLPTVSAMTTLPSDGKSPARDASGPLWNTWGPLVIYANGWQLEPYWSADMQGSSRKAVGMVGGRLYTLPENDTNHVMCLRTL